MQANVNDWHIDTALAYMQSDIGKFENVINPFSGELIDLSGRPTPYSPEITGNIGIARDLHLGDYVLTPRVDLSYVDDTQTKLWDTPLVKLDDRFLVNARLVLGEPDGKWSATLWGTNVFDKEYVAGIQNLATLYYAGRSREYGVSVRYSF